ncbi:MAG: YceI family protein [Saprospiraceae bacterium]|nr:YceI family protein [Saprospiraceae bacterium]HMW39081.1 YceI family protein [Saprospiraceae bacterium]HMX87951.1 YceI family protein [Saprospiraceae bacterium]HMZ39999.1 YceI family protein [Saprospiraceae bacterium]HNA63774.1 YceI family protein [Saprospiraceae bacterium]
MKFFYAFAIITMVIWSCKSDTKYKSDAPGSPAASAVDYGTLFRVNQEQSIIYWTGSSATGQHNGTLRIKSGRMDIDSYGQVHSGDFVIDMTSISNIDINDPKDKADLEKHLKSADFFACDSFPEASFHIISSASLADSLTNCLTHGTLNLRGIDQDIDIKAKVIYAGNTTLINIPEFTINRTLWGINYHSTKIADLIKDELISDNLRLSIKLLLVREAPSSK